MDDKFEFDPKTGTMKSRSAGQTQTSVPKETGIAGQKEVKRNDEVVKMKRVNRVTPVQLIDANGLPEAYLDSVNTGITMFRDRSDYDICQITDEATGKILAYISGYALQINFNMAELNTMERIEKCLEGLVKLFRHKIMTQNIDIKFPE